MVETFYNQLNDLIDSLKQRSAQIQIQGRALTVEEEEEVRRIKKALSLLDIALEALGTSDFD